MELALYKALKSINIEEALVRSQSSTPWKLTSKIA